MPRIAGVDVPEDKPVWVSLTSIYGIGESRAREIVDNADISKQQRAYELTEDQISRLNGIIEENYRIEGELRHQVEQNIQRLKEIDCYRGERHRKGLPVRGQRTQSNARTRKGDRRTVPTKKGLKEKH